VKTNRKPLPPPPAPPPPPGHVRNGIDVEMVVTMLFGAGIQRVLTGGTLDDAWPERVVAAAWPLLDPARC
jgi:hypothetical protein